MVKALSALVMALRCAESPVSSIPSFIFVFSMAALFYKILHSSRRRFIRRLTTSPVWNLMVLLLLVRTVTWWMRLVGNIDYVTTKGRKMVALVATEALIFFSIPVPDAESLPPVLKAMLDPTVIKVVICTLLSFLPLLVLFFFAPLQGADYPAILLWVDHRWARNELGSGVYFLERPVPQERNREHEAQGALRASTGSIRPTGTTSSHARQRQSI